MALNQSLVSQFAKLVNTTESKPETKTVTGIAKLYGGKIYVQIDGSDQLTPIASSTVGMNDGDRITVEIKNHSVSVTGNSTDPAASSGKLDEVDDRVHTNSNKIGEFNTLIADMVTTDDLTAINANIDNLIADNATITGKLDAVSASVNDLEAKNVTITGSLDAVQADIDQIHASMLTADVADIKYATIDSLEATNANIHNLEADYGEFKQLSTEKFDAVEANIQKLDAEKLTATDADLKYANIDFANIGKAAIENFFAKSGMIGDLVVGDGTITGTLVGVTIKGDLIEGGTVKADKLVVQGEDGLYYKLNVSGETVAAEQTDYNSLNGSIITAKSITAEKISVNDLVAFGATIGGFHITEDSLYSGVKETVDNTTRGTYMNDDGEFAIGDGAHYLKFFKDADGIYKLAISADAIKFGTDGSDLQQSITQISTKVESAQNDATQAIEKTAELEQTAESITAEVSKVSETANEASKQATTAQQTAEGLTTKVEEAVNTAESAKTTATEAKQTADGLSTTVSEVKQTADGAMEKATTVAQTVDGLEVKIDGIADPKENILLNTQNFSYYSNGSANGALMSAPNVNGTYLGLTVRGTTGIPANQSTGASLGQYYVSDFSLGDKFTFSFYAKGTVDKFVCFFYGANGYVTVAPIKNSQGYSSTGYGDGRSYFTCSQSWRRYWVTWQLNSSGNVSIPKYVLIRTDANTVSSANMYICGCRLETGDIANDWEPSPLDIGDAAKTATNYLKFDSSGLCVGNMTGSLGYNALITSSQYQIRNGSTVLSSFGASQVNLGQNSKSSQIKLCNGMGTIRVQQGATRDSLYVETAGDMVISGNGTNLYGAYINLNGATYAGSDFFAQNGRVALGHNGTTLWGVYCGTSIVNPRGNSWYDLFTTSQQVSMFGRAFNVDKGDVFLAMNGDTAAQNIGIDCTYHNGGNTIGVSFNSSVNGNYRIQWLLVMGA